MRKVESSLVDTKVILNWVCEMGIGPGNKQKIFFFNVVYVER